MKCIIARFGEVFLKGDFTKKRMLRILINNIREELKERKIKASVHAIGGIIRIDANSRAGKMLERTFGIASFSQTIICKKDITNICKTAKMLSKDFRGTFAIEAKRADKSFPYTSQEIKIIVGKKIADTGLKVDLSKPKNKIYIEIRDECYIYTKIIPGPGGLPLGSSGKIIGFTDELLANWLLMKRGLSIILIGRKNKNYNILKKWSVGRRLVICKGKIEDVAKKYKVNAIVIKKSNNLLTLNPLVGLTNKEIKEMEKII